jgi:hypothetical protein
LGGHGYVREWGMEQLVRDARIAQIYEGTNGIQAMDFIGRKVLANGGQHLMEMRTEIVEFCNASTAAEMREFIQPLAAAVAVLEAVTYRIIDDAQKNANAVGAAAVEYLHLFGHIMYAYMWALMAQAAQARLPQDSDSFYAAKLQTARFFMQRCLPQIQALRATIEAGPDALMTLPPEQFAY